MYELLRIIMTNSYPQLIKPVTHLDINTVTEQLVLSNHIKKMLYIAA